MTCLAGLPLLVLHSQANVLTVLLISTSTSWLLAYIIAHVDVIVLRHRFPDARRPFKTPLYPVPQILGIGGMAYAVVYNSPTPELAHAVLGTAGLVIAIVCIGSALWVKLVMRRKLFEPDFVGQESELLPDTRAPLFSPGRPRTSDVLTDIIETVENTMNPAYIDKGSGQAVFFANGAVSDYRAFEAQIEALSKEYRVVAPTFAGGAAGGNGPNALGPGGRLPGVDGCA